MTDESVCLDSIGATSQAKVGNPVRFSICTEVERMT